MDKKQLLEDKFMTAARFSQEVEKIALHNPDMNYIDSVIHYCEVNEIELDSINKLISKPLKEKLRHDAQQLNFMKKTSRAKLTLVWASLNPKSSEEISKRWWNYSSIVLDLLWILLFLMKNVD